MTETQVTTYEEAKKKARYGHRDWISYTDKSGIKRFRLATAITMKEAMLATGTQKGFMMICANDAMLMKMSWWIANNVRCQMLRGWR